MIEQVRQAPNGVIHILSTMTHPCLHYEINEAWLESDDVVLPPRGMRTRAKQAAPTGGTLHAKTASGGNASWGYAADAARGYMLHGDFNATFPSSNVVEYAATYSYGVRLTEKL